MNEESEFQRGLRLALSQIVTYTPEYRWYYDDLGNIKYCAETNYPETEYKYITVPVEIYHQYYDYMVIDDRACKIDRSIRTRGQIVRANAGFPAYPNNAALLLISAEERQEYQDSITYYDYRKTTNRSIN